MAAASNILAFCLLISAPSVFCGAPGAPVILVPGDGGSQLKGKLDKSTAPHFWCAKKTEWFDLWLNLEELAPYALDCFVDNMKLTYDQKTRTTQNSPGVEIRETQFGNTSTIEWLDSSQLGPTAYFYHIAQALVNKGYTRNLNIRGAPYDFRKSPNELQDFIKKLTRLVEETYTKNGGQKVVLVGHSMGNPNILYMLNKQSQEWKDKHVKAYISLSAPFGGAVKTLRLLASGDNLGAFVVNPLTVRPMQRSMTSTMWLMPYNTFWNSSEILVSTPGRNYTVNDYKQFFTDIGYNEGYLIREDTEPLIKPLTPPGVEVHCLHGIKVKTVAGLEYTGDRFPDDQPNVIWGDGDGTVNKRSLHGCLNWQNHQKQSVYHKMFDFVDHLAILKSDDAIKYIIKVAYS